MPSTAIRNTQYDPATRILSVWFVPSGHRYDYADVAPATYAAFRKAASKGRFFHEFIREHYSYRRVAGRWRQDRLLRKPFRPTRVVLPRSRGDSHAEQDNQRSRQA